MQITLPWPDKRLSPNARVHWAQKAKATKTAKQLAYATTMAEAAGLRTGEVFRLTNNISVYYVFYPGDNRRRDLDNLIASTKATTDGIAQALGVDDSKFNLGYKFGAPRKPACVVVTIE